MRISNGVLNLLSCLAIVWGQTADSFMSFKPFTEKHLWFKKFSEWNNRQRSVTTLCPCVTCPVLIYYFFGLISCKWKGNQALKKKSGIFLKFSNPAITLVKRPDICHKAIYPTALQYKVMLNSMLNKAGRNMLTEENESYLERTRELLVTNILTAQTFLTCLLPPWSF